MSRQFRYRMAALGLSALIFGAPLLSNGTASADQFDADSRMVSFAGIGMFGLSCGSRPSAEAMTVPASSVVRVVNQTGHDAQLRLGGVPRGIVPADGMAEVMFRRGTTAVQLTPECAFGEDVLPMLVTAAPSASFEQPGPTPEPIGGGSPLMSRPANGSPARTSGSVVPDSVAPMSEPTRTTSKGSRRGAHKSDRSRAATANRASATAEQAPQGDTEPRIKSKARRGTAGVGAPAFAGMPPGGRKSVTPSVPTPDQVVSPTAGEKPTAGEIPTAGEMSAAGEEPTVGGEPSGGENVVGGPADEPPGSGGLDAAQPVAAVGRIEDGHPLGLLGLTALVCVLGVATAAIRAIVSQRASRTNMA
ncbi:hypothetical protein Q0Z83_088530 [Actinoplanes sichuanensis]|uniref:Uncharacterized protein n=1 Tax=Actinoplanes sichuanensis TaxID=512349 RepID=A0ABW4A444_9ACTN|nr:hypothetical protein [Actinoplanes sichuanensis]BEL10662.1 hypothetical protein Q0Z83_088530 [Actinoplanes sichuanensis]